MANKEKRQEGFRRWRVANPGKLEDAVREWRHANPERSRELGRRADSARRVRLAGNGVLERVSLTVLADRDRDRCGVCGRKVNVKERSIDHIVPVSKGGEHSYANTRLAHRRCNSSRGNRGPAQIRLLG